MKKRDFLKTGSILALGALVAPLVSCGGEKDIKNDPPKTDDPQPNANTQVDPSFKLPELGYKFDALAPNIDAETVEIHYTKHHAGYVKKLNAALKGNAKFKTNDLAAIMAQVGKDDTAVRNNGGGHFNHSLYWDIMGAPKSDNQPTGDLAEALNKQFGSWDGFKEQFSKAAKTRFGSGWAWLSVNDKKELFISSTPNQDNPLMKNLVAENGQPILGIDVWEHAYYLNYQNMRGDYISGFFDLIQWDKVAASYKALVG
ncbi:MAG: superoxide dismutase [Saprospiraceae bacterium]|nr:superoxide dismutase [Saprospiraceae bacterium]